MANTPPGGLPVRAEPDPAAPVVTVLPEHLELTVVEQRGDWARVTTPEGWTGWVDARRLVEPVAPRRRRGSLIAVQVAGLVVSVAIAIWLGQSGGGTKAQSGSVILESAGTAVAPTATTVPPASPRGLVRANAASPGMYGGVRDTAECDASALSARLAGDATRAHKWAEAAGIAQADIARFISGLTPATLRVDTRVTDYSLTGTKAKPQQAVLQAGSAVLLDRTAMPRVRCASGDPLTQPRAVTSSLQYTGARWATFSPETIVVLTPAPRTGVLVLIDARDGSAFARVLGSATVIDLDQPAAGEHVIVVQPGGSFALNGTFTVTWDDPAAPLAVAGNRVKVPANTTPGAHTVTIAGVTKTVYVIPPAI